VLKTTMPFSGTSLRSTETVALIAPVNESVAVIAKPGTVWTLLRMNAITKPRFFMNPGIDFIDSGRDSQIDIKKAEFAWYQLLTQKIRLLE
jgi:hypothetical protein